MGQLLSLVAFTHDTAFAFSRRPLAFELREGEQDVEGHPSHRSSGIELLGTGFWKPAIDGRLGTFAAGALFAGPKSRRPSLRERLR
jgi:hypothetical protein